MSNLDIGIKTNGNFYGRSGWWSSQRYCFRASTVPLMVKNKTFRTKSNNQVQTRLLKYNLNSHLILSLPIHITNSMSSSDSKFHCFSPQILRQKRLEKLSSLGSKTCHHPWCPTTWPLGTGGGFNCWSLFGMFHFVSILFHGFAVSSAIMASKKKKN